MSARWLREGCNNMTQDSKQTHHEVDAHPDLVGKVFKVVSQDMRKCLVCDQVFTRKAACEHADTVCYPGVRNVRPA